MELRKIAIFVDDVLSEVAVNSPLPHWRCLGQSQYPCCHAGCHAALSESLIATLCF